MEFIIGSVGFWVWRVWLVTVVLWIGWLGNTYAGASNFVHTIGYRSHPMHVTVTAQTVRFSLSLVDSKKKHFTVDQKFSELYNEFEEYESFVTTFAETSNEHFKLFISNLINDCKNQMTTLQKLANGIEKTIHEVPLGYVPTTSFDKDIIFFPIKLLDILISLLQENSEQLVEGSSENPTDQKDIQSLIIDIYSHIRDLQEKFLEFSKLTSDLVHSKFTEPKSLEIAYIKQQSLIASTCLRIKDNTIACYVSVEEYELTTAEQVIVGPFARRIVGNTDTPLYRVGDSFYQIDPSAENQDRYIFLLNECKNYIISLNIVGILAFCPLIKPSANYFLGTDTLAVLDPSLQIFKDGRRINLNHEPALVSGIGNYLIIEGKAEIHFKFAVGENQIRKFNFTPFEEKEINKKFFPFIAPLAEIEMTQFTLIGILFIIIILYPCFFNCKRICPTNKKKRRKRANARREWQQLTR